MSQAMREAKNRQLRERGVSMQPLISVVVPVYGVEKYLKKCVESILHQTYQNLEILLVDDGSPDYCPLICDRYAKEDPRVRVIHKANGGLSSARNAGIEASSGEYIGFIDGDDSVEPDMLEQLERACSESGAEIAVCDYFLERSDGSQIFPVDRVPDEILTGDQALDQFLRNGFVYLVIAWNKLYARKLFFNNDIRYPVGRFFEDNCTTNRLLYKSERVALIGRPLYHYLQRDGSIMAQPVDAKKIRDRIAVADSYLQFAKETGAHFHQAQSAALLMLLYQYGEFYSLRSLVPELRKKILQLASGWRRNPYLSKRFPIQLILVRFYLFPYVRHIWMALFRPDTERRTLPPVQVGK